MYSGSSLTPISGRIMGMHQKIDRIARRNLRLMLKDNHVFPGTRAILHFEGFRGPDAIKIKSPAKDEPWHFYSPFNDKDSKLLELIDQHYQQLLRDLKSDERVRASFEAAWLAHAIVDGLTPAHHYPYEKVLEELRGEGIESRDTRIKKIVITGHTRRDSMEKNWKAWGPKGLMSTHQLFEIGVATLSAPLSYNDSLPSEEDIKEVVEIGLQEYFQRRAREIAILELYDKYYKKGWTVKLMIDIRKKLVPTIIKTVTLSWYIALIDAELVKKPKFKSK